jgi:DNA modification methylase
VGRALNNSSRAGDMVLDLFGGSGTTILACEQTERVGYVMELDEVYCDVIVKRYYHNFPNIEIKFNGEPFDANLTFNNY